MNLSMAYDMKKRNQKKMAKGGEVKSASNEARPMPSERAADSTMVSQNQPRGQSIPRPRIEAKSGPSMVKSTGFTSRLRDENDIMSSMPPKKYTGMSEDKGPAEDEYMSQKFAKGGMVNDVLSIEEADQDNVQHPDGLEETDSSMSPAKDEYMAQKFAEGGEVEMDHEDSIAAAIMAREARQMKLDSDSAIDHEMMMADGGMVDIDSNGEEQPNMYYSRNKEVLKENYDSDMDDVSQPMDSNEHGHELSDEDAHDMVSKIRSMMNKQRQFKVK